MRYEIHIYYINGLSVNYSEYLCKFKLKNLLNTFKICLIWLFFQYEFRLKTRRQCKRYFSVSIFTETGRHNLYSKHNKYIRLDQTLL